MRNTSVIFTIFLVIITFLIFRSTVDTEALKIIYAFGTAFLTAFVTWLFK
ncbi:hypothetical protein [Nostoc parmelioides]|nr:hypothetical protein [Nostoc parmelioides]